MSSEVGSDSGREAMSWCRGQEEESSLGRMVEEIDDDEVLSPVPLTSVPPMSRSPQQTGVSGGAGGRPLGRREMEAESGQRTAPAMLAAGLRLPFPRIVRKFLREWGIAPTQLCPNGWRILLGFLILWDQLGFPRPSVREFNSLYSFKSDEKRSGWCSISIVLIYFYQCLPPWYTSHEPTPESIERARKARAIDEGFRSSSALITEENLAAAQLSPATSPHSRPRQSGKEMKDIFALLKKKGQAGKGKRKAPSEDQPPAARPRPQAEEVPTNVPSPARSVEEITSFPTRGEPSSSPRDEEYLKLRGSIPKPFRDFFKSNSPTRGDIAELPSSARRTISVLGKSWSPDQQKYLDSMGTVESIVAASVNTSRAAIQLTSAVEKMGRMLNDIQVMWEEGKKVQAELAEEKRLRASSEDILLRRKEELKKKEDELKALVGELEAANKSRADLEHDLQVERKSNAELKTALEKNADKEEAVAEFRSSNAYLAEQELVYFLTMEELIETTVEKRPNWDVQFLRDELSDLKRKSTLNPPSPEEVDPDQTGAEE
ncbi:Uncharacterized protein Adt_23261 [Abeliophyllum distichum]|uniref:Transposase (putative) gypsy type domain-containing protein n=1 Tax=Abeliophyllum distichum TaxID=126358 RepID=A0ABD1SAN3_9LAMI